MTEKISVEPMGIGPRPANAVSYFAHTGGTYVRWKLNRTGWAIGYRIAYIESRDMTEGGV